MKHMGGKQRQSKRLRRFLENQHGPDCVYYEPFCGALGSAEKLVPYFKSSVLSDASQPLTNFWNAVLKGWQIPDFVSEDEYKKYADRRHSPDASDPMTAWCGYAISFGGKWFGGYARQGKNKEEETRKSQINQKQSALRKMNAVRPYVQEIQCMGYVEAFSYVKNNAVVYLDPPYVDRTRAHHTARGFDHPTFWKAAEDLSARAHVYVSEFVAPESWTPVLVWGDTIVRHNSGKRDGTVESLYKYGGER